MFRGAASLLNAEIKHLDTAISSGVSSTGAVVYLGAIPQGDGTTSRDGNSVKLKGGALRLVGTMNTSASRTMTRIMVVLDTRNAGSNPAIADILTSSSVTAQPNLVSEPGRYVILHDFCVGTSITGQQIFSHAISLDALVDVHLVFSGTAGTVADATGPAVFLVMVSNEPTNTPSVSGVGRLLFLDN
jgi:hypothetical protein